MRDDFYVRREDNENCWYKDFCEKYGTSDCKYTCKKFTQTDYMFQLSNLPKRWWKPVKVSTDFLSDYSAEILNTIVADCEFFVLSGFNLYLYGHVGVGKTSWAIKIMNRFIADIAERNDFTPRAIYVNVPSFLRDAKLHMKYVDNNYLEFLKTIQTCNLVVWDEIGQTDPTNFESQWLYSYINERIFAGKSNIFTSNLSPDKLREIDKRLESRICQGSDCIEVEGEDMRPKTTYTSYMSQEVNNDGTDTDTEQDTEI